jgi:hypothetical protein
VHAETSVPLHAPAHMPVPVHGGRLPTGAPVAGEQVPAAPPTLQAAHWLVHAELQHTPSTQKPEPHWMLLVHGVPRPSRPVHALPMQVSPATQSLGAVQVVLHAVAPHTYGVHAVTTGDGQWPAPSQFCCAVWLPAVQLGAMHCTVG